MKGQTKKKHKKTLPGHQRRQRFSEGYCQKQLLP
jgi:hypothetical protein